MATQLDAFKQTLNTQCPIGGSLEKARHIFRKNKEGVIEKAKKVARLLRETLSHLPEKENALAYHQAALDHLDKLKMFVMQQINAEDHTNNPLYKGIEEVKTTITVPQGPLSSARTLSPYHSSAVKEAIDKLKHLKIFDPIKILKIIKDLPAEAMYTATAEVFYTEADSGRVWMDRCAQLVTNLNIHPLFSDYDKAINLDGHIKEKTIDSLYKHFNKCNKQYVDQISEKKDRFKRMMRTKDQTMGKVKGHQSELKRLQKSTEMPGDFSTKVTLYTKMTPHLEQIIKLEKQTLLQLHEALHALDSGEVLASKEEITKIREDIENIQNSILQHEYDIWTDRQLITIQKELQLVQRLRGSLSLTISTNDLNETLKKQIRSFKDLPKYKNEDISVAAKGATEWLLEREITTLSQDFLKIVKWNDKGHIDVNGTSIFQMLSDKATEELASRMWEPMENVIKLNIRDILTKRSFDLEDLTSIRKKVLDVARRELPVELTRQLPKD